MAFSGFPAEAFDLYERLARDNSRPFWQANKDVYERSVKQPLLDFVEAIGDYGPLHLFRPYRDVRFAKDKTPYKENAGAYGETSLKTAPRGFPKDHPRIELLRRKGLFAGKEWPLAKWMHTKAALDRVMGVWRDAAPLTEFLDAHVGPSTLPPDDFHR